MQSAYYCRFRDEKVAHPTQKPLTLTDRLVRHFSNPGDLVIVPFFFLPRLPSIRHPDRTVFCSFAVNLLYLAQCNIDVAKV